MREKAVIKQAIIWLLLISLLLLLSSCLSSKPSETPLPLGACAVAYPVLLAEGLVREDLGLVREDLGLVLTATINKAEAQAGETITCRVSLRNIGPAVARLGCLHSYLFVLALVDERGNTVWSSMPDFIIGGPQDITIKVGKELAANFQVPLSQKGEYQLVAATTAKAPYPPDSPGYYSINDLSVSLKIRVK